MNPEASFRSTLATLLQTAAGASFANHIPDLSTSATSMSTSHINKRPRLDFDEDADKALINHPSLYFDDGSVILSCGSTLFRVHRSLLSKHSPVFRELLVPKEDRKPQFLRDCLHVALDDTREEIEALLNIIYDGMRVDFPKLTVETFPTLGSIFRMSTKYKLNRPHVEILERIKQEWPFELARHDAKMDALRRKQMQLSPFIMQGGRVAQNPQYNPVAAQAEDIVVHPAGVIAVLRDGGCSAPEILVPLFYALSCDTWQFGGSAVGYHIAPLSPADTERFIVGLERLRSYHAASATQCPAIMMSTSHAQNCLPGVRRYWADLAAALFQRKQGPRRPIEDWKDMISVVGTGTGGQLAIYSVCGQCSRSLVNEMHAIRQRLWAQLPFFFEL